MSTILDWSAFPDAEKSEFQELVGCLQTILGNDNEARKASEKNLETLKTSAPHKYATYITAVINNAEAGE